MWWKIKSDEEKEEELQAKLVELETKFKDEINNYCKLGDYIFIFKGFKIDNGKICVKFKDGNTVEGYTNYYELSWFDLKFGSVDFKKARYQFVVFEDRLRKVGLKLEKIS